MRTAIVMTAVLTALGASSVMAVDAAGSAFGNLQTASAIGQGHGAFGTGIGIADATSFVGWFQYGLAEYVDGRVKVGLVDPDGGDTEITFGADLKYQLWNVLGTVERPLDLAVGGFLEYADYDGSSVFQVGGQVLGSYPFTLRNGSVLSPYGRFNIRLEHISWEAKVLGVKKSGSDSELEFGLNGGVAWEATNTVTLLGEFQIDGNDGLFLGATFDVL